MEGTMGHKRKIRNGQRTGVFHQDAFTKKKGTAKTVPEKTLISFADVHPSSGTSKSSSSEGVSAPAINSSLVWRFSRREEMNTGIKSA